MKNRTLILFILIFSQIAGAGIRVINNGGGMAEMRALTALANLRIHFMPCLLGDNSLCTEEQRRAIQKLDQDSAFDTSMAELEFFSSNQNGWHEYFRFSETNLNYLSILSAHLYNQSHESKSSREIFESIAQAWLSRPHIDSGAATIAVGWLKQVRTEIRPSFAFATERQLNVILSQRLESNIKKIAVIEVNKSTAKDLTMAINAQLPCVANQAEIVEFTPKSIEHDLILGSLDWRCGPTTSRAKFAMSLASEQNGDLQIVLSQIQQLNVCASYLGSQQ